MNLKVNPILHFSLILLYFFASNAFATKVRKVSTILDEIKTSELIVKAKILTQINDQSIYFSINNNRKTRIQITQTFKGKTLDSIIDIVEIKSEYNTSYPNFSPNETYIFLLSKLDSNAYGLHFNEHRCLKINNQIESNEISNFILDGVYLSSYKKSKKFAHLHNEFLLKYLLNNTTRLHVYSQFHILNNTSGKVQKHIKPFTQEQEYQLFETLNTEDSINLLSISIIDNLTTLDKGSLTKFYVQHLKKSNVNISFEIIRRLSDLNPNPDIKNLCDQIIKTYFVSPSETISSDTQDAFKTDKLKLIELISKF